MSPSAPDARGGSNHDSATARATEQAMSEYYFILQACSARRRNNHPSWRAFAFASRPTNCLASSDQRPATSIPRTTSRARARGLSSSGYRLSLRRLAAVKATPSTSAAPLIAVPSPWRVLTMVASTANCAPPYSGKPSTATSSRRASARSGISKSRSLTRTFVVTRPLASRHTRASAPLPVRKLSGDGQGSGHTGSRARLEEEATGGDVKGAP